MEFKNNIMLILKHPIRAIIEITKFALPIMLAFLPFILDTKKVKKTITIESSTMNIN